ncbi:hypothetical protein [Taibaiella sp. KBW10]|uniref:hypothetical protein n=1 Tax=Taibaiella sp. KBW10 TaxID=2153357 RepID=UPI000F5A308D|nr:hypothetical protein [Taibaiella sp. KBW10]
MIIKLKWIFLILILTNCKAQNAQNAQNVDPAKVIAAKEISKTDRKEELYVGKEFYSGDELNTYTSLKSDKIQENDSLTYSIYKKNNEERYLFSIEKLLSNEDQELYKIIDVFEFNGYNAANHKVETRNQKEGYSILLLDKDKVLKKWDFALNNSAKSQSWNGKYECNFLRIKEESADPRAYAMININIEGNKVTFRLDSYKEILDKDLLILERNPNKIVLREKDNINSKFSITRKNDEVMLTSDLLNKITGEITSYKLKKNQ